MESCVCPMTRGDVRRRRACARAHTRYARYDDWNGLIFYARIGMGGFHR
ncbi:unnamed protein product [Periconia digitata]|uniref:Uncharacterized protein n=1 Tax=Periconia digitata TaxID=1303443 RepID=A0A9W4UQ79_9PLEO|nr:unnamed protein product [Periconia digitata]